MELHKAIKEIIDNKGSEIVCNIQIINYLLDYQAFKEKPATKLILRDVINSGYAEEILSLTSKETGWQTKFRQFQHEFIDSCGYNEGLASYVFEAIAYGLGLNEGEGEPEMRPAFNVNSFFDLPTTVQSEQGKPDSTKQVTQIPPSDFYTIANSFYNEGKYQQAKGFLEKALLLSPNSCIPSHHLKLMGDITMKMGAYQEAIDYYNKCFVNKASELQVSIDEIRESLKEHSVKGYENSMFFYYFCLYNTKVINDTQWLQFVKGEACYGLIDAIQYCANQGIRPIEDHIDIFFTDKKLLRDLDYLYDDGTFAHEKSSTKKAIARVFITETSEYEKSHGWNSGYLIPLEIDTNRYKWSLQYIDLPFPHSHYTSDDLNHWEEIKTIESEQYIDITKDTNNYPIFKAVQQFQVPIPILGTSGWFVPNIHTLKRLAYHSYSFPLSFIIWTSSQADAHNAISCDCRNRALINHSFACRSKEDELWIMPVAAF